MANSSQLSLPRIIAPAASMRATAVQSYGGTNFSRIFEPAVDRTSRVTITSFIATGTPASGGSGFPATASLSISAALAFALFRGVRNAPISGSSCLIRVELVGDAVAVVRRSATVRTRSMGFRWHRGKDSISQSLLELQRMCCRCREHFSKQFRAAETRGAHSGCLRASRMREFRWG